MDNDESSVIKPLTATFPEDPYRCEGIGPAGQCTFRAEVGSKFCRIHGGRHNTSLAAQARSTFYQLDETEYIKQFAQRVDALGYSHDSRSLRSELGILRATLERILTTIADDESLTFRSGELIALSARIESLQKTSMALEKELGELMSIEEAKELAADLLKILFDEIEELQNKENFRASKARELIDRLVLPDELKNELRGYFEPLGLQTALENIADSFGDTVNGAGSKRHKK